MTGRARTGFTLIELLAASALAALLMLVLFQVIGSLGRARAAMSKTTSGASGTAAQAAWKSDLLDLLRWDLANAGTIQLESNRVTLEGTAALDRRSLTAGQEPVTVVYALERRGSQSCLVRRQSPRGTATNAAGWSELVCADVSAFELSAVRTKSSLSVVTASTRSPTRVRIAGPTGPTLDATIIVK
jgi:prepilin-type N-terminal cleavage/methylation domain-containing protein